MKKFKKLYILLAVAAIGATSCSKSFLDEKPPTADPVADAIKTENDMADAVNGMNNSMRSVNSFGATIPVLGDLLADNAYISTSNSGYWKSEQDYSFTASTTDVTSPYGQCYYTILQANRIIYYGKNLPQTNNVLELLGEAYATRALNYLTLVNLYATPYTATGGSSALGVPLVTAPTNITGPFNLPARATVGTIYNKIISDLDSAYAIMPVASTTLHAISPVYMSKYAAKAIEARAYLYKGDYANARDAALVVVQNGGYSLTTAANLSAYWATPSPAAGSKVESIFELENNLATNNGTSGVDYYYNQNGYGQNLIYSDLYNQYTATDARKGLLISGTKAGNPAIILNKYSNTTNATDKDNVKIIRYAEVLLTLAEGYASAPTPDLVNALVYLNMVAKNRDPSFIGYTSTPTTIVSDILNERRKELVGEGLRLADLNRLGLTINRPAQVGIYSTLQVIPTTNSKRLLPIPQAEIDANKSTVQNPGY